MKKRVLVKILLFAAIGVYLAWQGRPPRAGHAPAPAAAKADGPVVTTTVRKADGTIVRTGTRAPAAGGYDRNIIKVSDGDTLILSLPDGGSEKVRLLGVDTPEKFDSDKLDKQAARMGVDKNELIKLGQRASAHAEKLCAGRRCRLVLDDRPKDDYGRTLGYVYLDNGVFLNEALVRDGYASVYQWFTYSQREHFLKLENDARKNQRGLWATPLFVRLAGR